MRVEEGLEAACERRALTAARVRQEELVTAAPSSRLLDGRGVGGGGVGPLGRSLVAAELLNFGQDLLAVQALANASLFEVLAGEDGERFTVTGEI